LVLVVLVDLQDQLVQQVLPAPWPQETHFHPLVLGDQETLRPLDSLGCPQDQVDLGVHSPLVVPGTLEDQFHPRTLEDQLDHLVLMVLMVLGDRMVLGIQLVLKVLMVLLVLVVLRIR